MADDVGTVAMLCGATALMSCAYDAQHGRSVAGPLIASAVSFGTLSFVGSIWRWDIVTAIAGLFFLSALLTRGVPLLNTVTALSNPAPVKATDPTPTNATANAAQQNRNARIS